MNLNGCVTPISPSAPVMMPKIDLPSGSIYHEVKRGQTLWAISKIYGVDIDEIVKINHITETAPIEINQLLFIPAAQKQVIVKDVSASLKSSGDDFIWPVKGRVISRFGENSNYTKNKGMDIQASYGSDVYASRNGVVTFYDASLKGFGKTLIIQHDNVFSTVYARNCEIFAKVGDRIRQGELIAKVGSSGRNKNSYLHFEIRKKHVPQNPAFYLP